MSWLKTVGAAIAKGFGVATPFVNVLAQQGGTAGGIGQIAQVVVQTEAAAAAMGTLKGAEKLKMAAPMVGQLIQQSGILAGHRVADAQAYQAAVATITGGFADLLNSLSDASLIDNSGQLAGGAVGQKKAPTAG